MIANINSAFQSIQVWMNQFMIMARQKYGAMTFKLQNILKVIFNNQIIPLVSQFSYLRPTFDTNIKCDYPTLM